MIKKSINTPLYIWIFIFILFGSGVWYICNQTNSIKDYKRNINSYQTELVQLKTQNGELITYNNTYKLKINELDSILDVSKQEIKDIQKELDDKVNYILSIKSNIRIDTLKLITNIEKKDSLIKLKFDWKDDWVNLNGTASYRPFENIGDTYIHNLNINMPLVVGITEDYKIFAKTDNPYVYITSLEGAEIDKNIFQKKWDFNWTFQLGMGLTYGLINKQLDLGPTVSWGFEIIF